MNNITLPEKINIAFCVDNNFIQHLTVALYSLCVNLNKERLLDVYIVYNDLEQEKMDRLIKDMLKFKHVQIFFIKDKKNYSNLKTKGKMTQSAYLKINLPNTLPANLSKVLCLDCDIVVTGDITPLYNKNVKYLMAVKDVYFQVYAYYDMLFQAKSKNVYFNSGVMLMNLKSLRDMGAAEIIIDYVFKYSHYFCFHDQTGFNYFLYDKYEPAHPKFNLMQCPVSFRNMKQDIYDKREYDDAKKNPVIIHYSGIVYKPWEYESIGPYKELYYKYIAETSYKNYKPQKTIKKVCRKFKNYFIFMILPVFLVKLLGLIHGKIFLYKNTKIWLKNTLK